jgi:2-polyprenyl-3-methyl-5-hydroxy-6-metoxy-1,4-benzoquinol methylase
MNGQGNGNDSAGEFSFGWKKWKTVPPYAQLTLQHQKGDVLDVGCATCELYSYLRSNGWTGNYYGVDLERYADYDYPEDANLVIGDAMDVDFPEVDTVVLYNILEHVENPQGLLVKSLKSAKKNVLIHIPKRNEELWKYGIVEMHQLDKTHKNCGFTREEICNLVDKYGGKVVDYKEFGEINPAYSIGLWDSKPVRLSIYVLRKFYSLIGSLFSLKTFYQEMWLEVVKK